MSAARDSGNERDGRDKSGHVMAVPACRRVCNRCHWRQASSAMRSSGGPQARTFHALNALSSSSPSIANATDGKCRAITVFIEFSSTQSIPGFV